MIYMKRTKFLLRGIDLNSWREILHSWVGKLGIDILKCPSFTN